MTFPIMGGGFNATAPAFPVQRSVRLRSSAPAYFNRTFTTPTNQAKWTWSGWVKRGQLGILQRLLSSGTTASDTTTTTVYFTTSDTLAFSGGTTNFRISNQVFRDPSSWYHIVIAVDTTLTEANKILIYVNGVQITFATTNAITTCAFNSAQTAYIGQFSSSQYLDGYLAEVYFIDGQPLTPSSFGSYNIGTGVWQPIKYAGTYGTNGFYLNFQDNSNNTATTIGKDSSGNGNNWTPNGITLTPTTSVSYDSMLDVPTNTSNTNANFAVMNPLKIYTSNLAFSNGNLTLSDSNAVVTSAISTMSFGTSGKYYFECTMVAVPTANSNYVGVIDATTAFGTAPFQNKGEYRSTGDIYNLAGTAQTAGATYTTNDVIGVAVDVTAGTVKFYKNGVAQGATPSFTFTAGTELWACISADNQAGAKTYALNFGQRPFSYPLAGFNPLCTYNLTTPLIPNGAGYMAATTYTGTGSALTIANTTSNPLVAPYSNNPNAVPMQPDFVWIKDRTSALNHRLLDSVRGVTSLLYSNTTDAQVTIPNANDSFTSFNSNGFTLGVGQGMNASGDAYVGWQWKAGGTAVTNTVGSISSQVSANTTAGFSIVTYTGTGANATVGHGLNIAPKMVIIKNRTEVGVANNWCVYNSNIGSNVLLLNTTPGQSATDATNFCTLGPSTLSLGAGNSAFATQINVSTETYVAYCWSEIPGFSKFGSYTGNGAPSDGTFVYLGFRPRFIMVKSSTLAGTDWAMWDTSRDTYNIVNYQINANSTTTGATPTADIDILSNGFKAKRAGNNFNASGATYIYMAFAENPFNYSLAR